MYNIFFVHKQHDFLWYQGDNQILSSKQTGTFFHNFIIVGVDEDRYASLR